MLDPEVHCVDHLSARIAVYAASIIKDKFVVLLVWPLPSRLTPIVFHCEKFLLCLHLLSLSRVEGHILIVV